MQCKRCGCAFGQEEQWAMVTRHNAPLEPVGFFYLCEDCHVTLMAWVGVAPDTPDLWRVPEPDADPLPGPPISCGGED